MLLQFVDLKMKIERFNLQNTDTLEKKNLITSMEKCSNETQTYVI